MRHPAARGQKTRGATGTVRSPKTRSHRMPTTTEPKQAAADGEAGRSVFPDVLTQWSGPAHCRHYWSQCPIGPLNPCVGDLFRVFWSSDFFLPKPRTQIIGEKRNDMIVLYHRDGGLRGFVTLGRIPWEIRRKRMLSTMK